MYTRPAPVWWYPVRPTLFQLLHTPFTSSSAHLFPISSSGAKYLTQSFPYNRLLLPLLPSHLRFFSSQSVVCSLAASICLHS
ncbi:Actin-related protein 2/3 complex subunit 2 [Fusarium oxysporum f. sp. albedinis]|nr:Actin-related protein 2/3 complex subunit 2 [Fusarium oxysporum f. sp. albedinis]